MKALGLSDDALLIGGVVVALVLWQAYKGAAAIASNPGGTAQAVSEGAVAAVNGVLSGAVIGVGQAVGVPATNSAQCNADMAAGNTSGAAFSCHAATFMKYLFGGYNMGGQDFGVQQNQTSSW